jgi:GTP pyrophosphokinase
MAVQQIVDLSTEKFIRDMSEINPKYDDSVVIKAYEIARELHDGQFRKSGEPYIIHPVAVAKILAGFGMDNECSCRSSS